MGTVTHNCQLKAFVLPRVCICVSGWKKNVPATDTCTIHLSLAVEHVVLLQKRTKQAEAAFSPSPLSLLILDS